MLRHQRDKCSDPDKSEASRTAQVTQIGPTHRPAAKHPTLIAKDQMGRFTSFKMDHTHLQISNRSPSLILRCKSLRTFNASDGLRWRSVRCTRSSIEQTSLKLIAYSKVSL